MAVNFDVQERLTSAQEAVQSELNVLNQGLQKRQQAAKVKALLKLMQDTAHVMSKVGQHVLEQVANNHHCNCHMGTAPFVCYMHLRCGGLHHHVVSAS